jgi:hypothetical protein
MGHIDRTIVGNERRRWHPVDPFQMKRHGDDPGFRHREGPAERNFRQTIINWLTECAGFRRKFAVFLTINHLEIPSYPGI